MIRVLFIWSVAIPFLLLPMPVHAAMRYTVVTEVVPEGKSEFIESVLRRAIAPQRKPE